MFTNHTTSKVSRVDPAWRGLLRVGAVGAWGQVACVVGIIVALSALGPRPDSAAACFAAYQEHWLLGLLRDDFLSLLIVALYSLTAFGLYAGLRREHPGWAACATALMLVAVTASVATDSSIAMLRLSARHAAATTDADRAVLVAAGEALIAGNMWNSTAGVVGGVLLQGAGLLVSVLMWRSPNFARLTAIAGLGSNGPDLAQHVFRPLAPVIGDIALWIAGPLYIIWFAMIGRDLVSVARRAEVAD